MTKFYLLVLSMLTGTLLTHGQTPPASAASGGNRLAYTIADTLVVRDLGSGGSFHKTLGFPGRDRRLLAFDPSGTRLLVSFDHQTRIYKISPNDASLIATLNFPIVSARFSPDGKKAYLLQGYVFKGKLSIYDLETWKKLKQTRLTAITGDISVSADDSLLSFGSLGKIKTDDAQLLKPAKVYWERQAEQLIVFNPASSAECATATAKNTIQLIDLQNDSILLEIRKHTARIVLLRYRRDGRLLLSLDATGKLCVWSLKEKTLLAEVDHVGSMPFWDGDGRLRLAAASDKIIPLDTTGIDHRAFVAYHAPTAEKFISPAPGYAPETGFTAGVGLVGIVQPLSHRAYYRPSVYTASITYGFVGHQVLSKLSTDVYLRDRWELIANLGYDAHGRNFYFGIGGSASAKDKQAYFSDNFSAAGTLFRFVDPQIGIGLGFDVRHNSKAVFQDEGTQQPFGVGGGSLAGVGPSVRWDSRDNSIAPASGHLLDLSYLRYGPLQAGDYRYNEARIDYRQYFPIGPSVNGRQIAIQGAADLTWGGDVPFYSLPYFTADRVLRGIYRNLYIAKQVAYAQAEYRSLFTPVDPRFGYVIFVGAGDGADNFFNRYSPSIKGVYGLGLRQQLFPKNSFLLRLDAAFTSKGEFGFFAGLGVSF